MFEEQEIIEFFNRIINASNVSDQEIKTNVKIFYEYLVLTKMCNGNTQKKLSTMVNIINEIIVIKKAIGYIDLKTLLIEPEEPKKLVKKPKPQKHYNHYETGGPSFCGSSSSSSSGSSSSYSSSCGIGSYTRRC